MKAHLDEQQLNDCADGALDPAERARAEAHLAACDACRDAIDRLRQLRSELASLPRSITPPPQVLMGVRAMALALPALHAERLWYTRPHLLAAAAVLLVVISSATTALLLRQPSGVGTGATAPPPTLSTGSAGLVAVHAMERSYEDAIAEVQSALREHQSSLAPETLHVLQANLDIVDRALAEARSALRADPGNDALTALVRSGYERKLDVLRSASSHARARS
ncbi:MAG: anti-sigma factor family protein [Longimicrobiales bacterium]